MNFSTMQEWVDGFSGLPNYTKESIEAWYQLRPKIVKYPETVDNIRLGFDNKMIDDAIKSLVKENDPDRLAQAKNILVSEMAQTFSLGTADSSVLDMNEAIFPAMHTTDIRQELPVGTKVVCNKTGKTGTIVKFISWNQYIVDFDGTQMQITGDDFTLAPKEVETEQKVISAKDIKKVESEDAKVNNFSAFDNNKLNEIYNYIGELNNCDSKDVKEAVLKILTHNYPTSRHAIEQHLMRKYRIPMDSEGQPLNTIFEYIKAKEAERENGEVKPDTTAENFSLSEDEKWKVVKDALVKEGFQASDDMVNDLANLYYSDDADMTALSKAIIETFKFYKMDADEETINKVISEISSNLKSKDEANFSRKDCIEELDLIFRKHRLGIGANEVKFVYDEFLKNDLDLDKTAELLAGVKTVSGEPLKVETAKEILKHFTDSVREKRLSDGFVNFSQENFNKIVEDASELADLAAEAGIDDRFIFDNYDEINKGIAECKYPGQVILVLTALFIDKKEFESDAEAMMAAEDFYEVLSDSKWLKKHTRSFNFSNVERLSEAGYSDREIAVKLHKPLSEVNAELSQNFSIGSFVSKIFSKILPKASVPLKTAGGKYVRGKSGQILTHSVSAATKEGIKHFRIGGWVGEFLSNKSLWDQFGKITKIAGALGISYMFVMVYWDKLMSALKKKTDEERYQEIMKVLEEDRRYKNQSGRLAKAFLQKVHAQKLDRLIDGIEATPVTAKSFSRQVVLLVEEK